MDYDMGYGLFSFISGVFPIIFVIMFVTVIGVILATLFRGVHRWGRNNAQPRIPVAARVVSKRMDVRHHHGSNDMNGMHTSHSTYYVTFEFDSGDRLELQVPDSEYGMLVEGDSGVLTFQGTRFLGFERTVL